MAEISVINSTKSKLDIEKISSKLEKFLRKHKKNENSEISVEIVTAPKMLEYVEKYLHETGEEAAAHPVLSFVQNELEGPFTNPPDNTKHLGEIIASVDHAMDEDELYNLIEHGALHLLGIHHD